MRRLSIFVFIVFCTFATGLAQGSFGIDGLDFSREVIIELSQKHLSNQDTLSYDIKLIYDQQKKPQCYYTKLITPVCETGVCKLVAISVYWDFTGNYFGYQLPPDRILTKLDHEPFTAEDYQKLDHILRDKYWLLANYEIDELIVDSTKTLIDSEIDAYSGATAKFVSEKDNIEGALYTIYTLWKFVHDQDKINHFQNYTAGLFGRAELQLPDFLQSSRESYQKWALAALDTQKFNNQEYFEPLSEIVLNADQFVAYDALKLMDLSDHQLQKDLWEIYKEVDMSKKRDIINKISSVSLDISLLQEMITYLTQLESYPEARLLIILLESCKPLSEEVVQAIRKIGKYENERVQQEVLALL